MLKVVCEEILAKNDESSIPPKDEEGFLELDFLDDSVYAHAIPLSIILLTDYQAKRESQPEGNFQTQVEKHVNNDIKSDDDLTLSRNISLQPQSLILLNTEKA